MSKYENLREEEIKNKVACDWFSGYDSTQIIGNIDFCIAPSVMDGKTKQLFTESELQKNIPSLLWAEAKKGIVKDINESFVQLILTIGKARTIENFLPPAFLGAFDAAKIAFIPYHKISKVFNQNDFNWNVTPSDHSSKEFIQLYDMVKDILDSNTLLFDFEENEPELKKFIKRNFKSGLSSLNKIQVTKNNFVFVYQKWCKQVMPTINVDWTKFNNIGVISADFFLADLLAKDNESIKENLQVVLKKNNYKITKGVDSELGIPLTMQINFKDNQKAYNQFWNLYERPPKEEYWDYIIERRDLLVPQDIRERKGSFFTPQVWVQKSQEYLASVLGDNWQDEYYIWDCCAGTGNLLNGLTNKRNIWASTLDKADVDVMKDRIANGWNMFENHVFQFDFLNDDFSKCPEELQTILNDKEKHKKLVVYINPPYAEHGSRKQPLGTGENKSNVATETMIYHKFEKEIGAAARELYAQFLIRIYTEIPYCIIANFSTLKGIQAYNFKKFRNIFSPKLERLFLVPANSFDNVNGIFPIGFFIWNTSSSSPFMGITADTYDSNGNIFGTKKVNSYDNSKLVIEWLRPYFDKKNKCIGYLRMKNTDIQNKSQIFITSRPSAADIREKTFTYITKNNVIQIIIYLTIRNVVEATWLNDRDQFLYPYDGWKSDTEFQLNCLIYTLFHGQNRISSEYGTNHWIPFSEDQLGSKKSFDSHFMSDFIDDLLNGKDSNKTVSSEEFIFDTDKESSKGKYVFSKEAKDVYDAGLVLWRYYFSKQDANQNASFYDIRKYFQGETNGRMNNISNDETYNHLIVDLRSKQKFLAKKIEEKVYKYGFLK